VPWPTADAPEQTEQAAPAEQTESAASGLSPSEAAMAILAHVADPGDTRRRVLLGEDAPGQVAAALDARLTDYERDPRFTRP